MSAFEAPALPGFGRDYSRANWNAQVAALLRQLDLVGVENSDSLQFRPDRWMRSTRQGCQPFGLGSAASVSAVARKR
jgi:hypothetical protein